MAREPTDPRWPPSAEVDFDSIMDRLFTLKQHHFPQHTVRDPADPFVQLLRLIGALGQHALGRGNNALLQLALKYATSRRALLSLTEVVSRPLLPMLPARGPAYAKLSAAPTADTVVVEAGTKIVQPGIADPVFSVDEAITTASDVLFRMWHEQIGSATTLIPPSTPISFGDGDSLIFGFQELTWDSVAIALAQAFSANDQLFALEFYNEEWGEPDSVTDSGSQLYLYVDTYLSPELNAQSIGTTVTVRHKTSGAEETATIDEDGGKLRAIVSYMGQSSPSTSAYDYEVLIDWRPVPDWTDETDMLSADGSISLDITDVLSFVRWWSEHDTYGYALKFRHYDDTTASLPQTLEFTSMTGDANFYALCDITQGYQSTVSLGRTDGSSFQHLPVPTEPIDEPVNEPEQTLVVGSDYDWYVMEDFSNSGSSSKHAIFREDVDDGWGIIFGDGTVGALPTAGEAVKLTYRTGSTQPGDLDPDSNIKAISGTGLARDWVLPRGTSGYEEPEASDKDSVLRFRHEVIPQLALRAESVVSPPEIVAALTGGAENRATFETEDGRKPFSRALYSTTGAGPRQYRVVVVGSESDDDGSVTTPDLVEAEEWLNGVEIGVEVIGGHGPQNTEAILGSFVSRPMLPTINLYVTSATGVRSQADQIIRDFFKPHSRDEKEAFRWSWGGKMPMALLFSLLWEGVPNKSVVQVPTVSVTDAYGTYDTGDEIDLDEFELPIISPSYDDDVNIVVNVVEE